MKSYNKIAEELIKRSFLSLKDEKIIIFEYPNFIFWANAFTIKWPNSSWIGIRRKIRMFDKTSKKGLIAHELCHLEIDKPLIKNILQAVFYWLKVDISWVFDTKFSRNIERKADILTIRKGYGRELLCSTAALNKMHSKKTLVKKYSRGYLSPEEIKKYAKSIRKW